MYVVNDEGIPKEVIMAIVAVLVITFLPAIIAIIKGNVNKMKIFFLDILQLVVLFALFFTTSKFMFVVVLLIYVVLWALAMIKAIMGKKKGV